MTSTMYKIKPLIELTDSDMVLNSSMYYMKNIQNEIRLGSRVIACSEDILNQIENEQDFLLKQITEIKELLTSIERSSQQKANPQRIVLPKISLNKPNVIQVAIIHDVVLNANYKRPPFSLLAINKIWPEILNVTYRCHVHSSVTTLPLNLNIFGNLVNPDCSNVTKNLRVRVVWKEMVRDCELIISPLSCVPLIGEVNFLRFLHKCVTPVHNDPFVQTLFEVKLDVCHSLYYCESEKQLQDCLSILSEGLETSKWMFGNEPTIIDVAAWSAIKNIKKTNLPKSLERWFQKFELFLKI